MILWLFGHFGPSWPSLSGDFAFGFRPLIQKDLFLWFARQDNAAPRGSKVMDLTADRGLVLKIVGEKS